MKIGVIGLGRWAANLSPPDEAGHHCVVFRHHPKPSEALAKGGAIAAGSLAGVVKAIADKPRAVWVMLAGRPVTESRGESRRPAGGGRHHHRWR